MSIIATQLVAQSTSTNSPDGARQHARAGEQRRDATAEPRQAGHQPGEPTVRAKD
jgi:hypothetical protein